MTCLEESCDRDAAVRGLCAMHYQRERRAGHFTTTLRHRVAVVDPEVWSATTKAVDYRLRIQAACARVRQARIALTAAPGSLPMTVDELLASALQELEL